MLKTILFAVATLVTSVSFAFADAIENDLALYQSKYITNATQEGMQL